MVRRFHVGGVAEGRGHVVEPLVPHPPPGLRLPLHDRHDGVRRRRLRERALRVLEEGGDDVRVEHAAAPSQDRFPGAVDPSQPREHNRLVGRPRDPRGKRDVLAGQAPGVPLPVPLLQELTKALDHRRCEPHPSGELGTDLAEGVGEVVPPPLPLAIPTATRRALLRGGWPLPSAMVAAIAWRGSSKSTVAAWPREALSSPPT